MKRTGLVLLPLLFVLTAPLYISAEGYDFDLTKMSLEELDNFESDVKDAKNEYHSASSDDKSAIRDTVKNEVESYYSDSEVDWAWIDYDYTKDWDYYTFSTHMDRTEGEGSKQREEVYAELLKNNGKYEIYYLKSGDELIIDKQGEIPEELWTETPDPFINETTGLDLSVLSVEELNDLRNKIDDEISANHKTSSTTTSLLLSLVKYQVEQKYNDTSWPWFDYSYTNDWGFYTLETSVNYKDENEDSQKADVYAEAYPTNGDYELYYLSVGDDVLIDKREELPEDLSSPEINETKDITETEKAETEAAETEAENENKETETELEAETQIESEIETEAETEENGTVHAPDTSLSGMIIEATMNTITIQTDDGETYICSTEDTDFDLASGGIMLGMEVEVTLESASSDENGLFVADTVTEVTEPETESELEQAETAGETSEEAEENESEGEEKTETETEIKETETEEETEAPTEAEIESETEKTEPNVEEDTVLFENGSSGDEVKAVQEKLIELGYLDGTADGIFGNMTEEALRAYQEENGLGISGAITSSTMAALNIQDDAFEENGENVSNEEEGDLSIEMAFVREGSEESSMFLAFDTDTNKAYDFETTDNFVMEAKYTGTFASGVSIDWSEYGDDWIEKFTYKSGSSSGTLTDMFGDRYEYESCEVSRALKVLNKKPGYESVKNGSEEQEQEQETEEKDAIKYDINKDLVIVYAKTDSKYHTRYDIVFAEYNDNDEPIDFYTFDSSVNPRDMGENFEVIGGLPSWFYVGATVHVKANLDSKGNLDTTDFDVHPLGTELDY